MADQHYQVIARKWRPATFSEVVGQEHVTRSLTNAIRQGKIHHAYLFSGPRGVGKTTVARILAKALNCVEGPTDTPCLKCSPCTSITEGTSLDVMEIDGASNNNVDQVRDLRETVGYATAQSRYRVVIIDEVHMLSRAAFNALLKTLEEPPSHVVFIFATTEPNKVIPTVQSRCQRYDFHRLTVAQIRSQLQRVCEAERIAIDSGGLDLIADHADGSMRDGESLLDQVAAATDGQVAAEQVADLIGAVERTVYIGLLDAIARQDIALVLSVVAETIKRGRSLNHFLSGLMVHLRHLLACSIGAQGALSELEPSDQKRLEEQAAQFSDRDLLRMLNIVAEAELALDRTAAPQVRVELALLKMAYLERSVELTDLLARLEQLGSEAEQKPPKPVARGPAPYRPATAEAAPASSDRTPPTTPSPRRQRRERSPPPAEEPPPPEPEDEAESAPQRPNRGAEAQPQPRPGAAASESISSPAHPRTSLAVLSARWPEIASALRQSETGAPPWLHQVKVVDLRDRVLVLTVEDDFFAERLNRSHETILHVVQERFPDVRDISVVAESPDAASSSPPERVRRGGSLLQGVVRDEPIVGKLIEELGLEFYE